MFGDRDMAVKAELDIVPSFTFSIFVAAPID